MVENALYQLQLHSEGSEAGNRLDLLADALSLARNGLHTADLGKIWDDIVSHLEVIREISPGESAADDCFASETDGPVVLISRLVNQCLNFFASQDYDWDARHEFLMLGWRINCAWDAINSGVEGNLAEYVENEAQARQFVD